MRIKWTVQSVIERPWILYTVRGDAASKTLMDRFHEMAEQSLEDDYMVHVKGYDEWAGIALLNKRDAMLAKMIFAPYEFRETKFRHEHRRRYQR